MDKTDIKKMKQHAVLDIFGGLILAFAVFRIRHVFDKVKI